MTCRPFTRITAAVESAGSALVMPPRIRPTQMSRFSSSLSPVMSATE